MASSLRKCDIFKLAPYLNRRMSVTSASSSTDVITQIPELKKSKSNIVNIFNPSERPIATVNPATERQISKGAKLGRSKLRVINPPAHISESINYIIENEHRAIYHHLSEYLDAGLHLYNFLMSRKIPMNNRYEEHTRNQLEERIRENVYSEKGAPGEMRSFVDLETSVQKEVSKVMKQKLVKWAAVAYDTPTAWAYLLGSKAAHDYACTFMVLSEIKRRCRRFKPKTIIDFGSGLGTASWAAEEVFGQLSEVFCVDSSPNMNDLARAIITRDMEDSKLPLGHFYRLQLPRSHETKYDLATCAFTLLDLTTEDERLTTVDALWRKVEPGGFLVLIEVGTNAGFQVLSEARHYLNNCIAATKQEDPLFDDEQDAAEMRGHLFAPCPHMGSCPRYNLDNIPCNFDVRYRNFPLPKMSGENRDTIFHDRFSYLVYQKGPDVDEGDCSWPRVVEQPFQGRSQVFCRLCTNREKLEEVMAGKTRYKSLYKYAKMLSVGQQMKVNLRDKDDVLDDEEEEEK